MLAPRHQIDVSMLMIRLKLKLFEESLRWLMSTPVRDKNPSAT